MTRLALYLALLSLSFEATGHEVRPARLTLTQVEAHRFVVRWTVPAMGDLRIAIDPIFPAACAAEGEVTEGYASGASVRTWSLRCNEPLAGTSITFANLPATMIDVLVQVSFLDGRHHVGLVRPRDPVFNIPTRASESAVFGSYFSLGVEHILFGWDHLLFVLGMVILVTNPRRLIWAVTGFTVAHSLSLALAIFDVVRVPAPPVEATIALSILFLAVESARHDQSGVETLVIRAPWVVSMTIGLVHGLGFAGALSEYGLPAYAEATALAAFNLGVEAGQLGFIAALILLGVAARRVDVRLIAPTRKIAIWGIGVCGAFWLVERLAAFAG